MSDASRELDSLEVALDRQAEPREPEPPKSKHDPGTSGFWWIPGGMLIAAAAAIVLWWLWPPNEEVRGLTEEAAQQAAAIEPLPTYVLETDGGLEQARDSKGSEQPRRHRYQRDTEFEWVLRPKAETADEVAVRAFAFVDGGSAGLPLAALDELAQAVELGAVRIAGTIEQLELEPGRYTIALAIGRPSSLPMQATEVHEPSADAAWQVRRIDIDIEE